MINSSGFTKNTLIDQLQRSVEVKANKKGYQHYGSLASQASKKTAGASEVTITTGPQKNGNKLLNIKEGQRSKEFDNTGGYRHSVDNGSSINQMSMMQQSQPELVSMRGANP